MSEPVWTHKGWLGVCPIYLAELDSPLCPIVDRRHWVFAPLFWVSELVLTPFCPDGFPLIITGEIR